MLRKQHIVVLLLLVMEINALAVPPAVAQARRVGVVGVVRQLMQVATAAQIDALRQAARVDRSWKLISPLVLFLHRPGVESSVRLLAAQTLARICDQLRRSDLQGELLPLIPELVRRLLALVRAEEREELAASLVRSGVQLAGLAGIRRPVRDLLRHPLTEVRLAALGQFEGVITKSDRRQLAELVGRDPDQRVALAAALALCSSTEVALSTEVLRRVRAMGRVRRLAERLDNSADQLVDIGRCLAASATAADAKSMDRIRKLPRVRRLGRLPW